MKPELVRGNGGVFEVTAEGEILFSKRTTGRFPEEGEVAARVEVQRSNPQP